MREPTRGPGRPRSEASRQAILEAALELLSELGYANVTVEGIAARAGAGKQTIYRWWSAKADVLLEAGLAMANLATPINDHGSYADDLRAFLESSYRMANEPRFAALLRGLTAEAQLDDQFAERLRAAFLDRRRDAMTVILDRAHHRGDLPPHPDRATVLDIVFGTIWYRILATQRPLDSELVEDLVSLLSGTRHQKPRPLTVHPRAKREPLPWRGSPGPR